MSVEEAYFLFKKKFHSVENASIYLAVQEVLGLDDRTSLIKSFKEEISEEDKNEIEDILMEVEEGKPLQYVLGHASFLGDEYYVSPAVLIPRPETEELVTIALKEMAKLKRKMTIVDVGTGSGVIAISVKKKRINDEVIAIDNSENALEVAMHNANMHDVKINFYLGNLINPLIEKNKKYDVVIANLPYIEKEEDVDPLVLLNEPRSAYLVKPGHKLYEQLFQMIKNSMGDEVRMYLEIHHDQKEVMQELCFTYFNRYSIEIRKDMSNHDRFVILHIWKENNLKN